MWETPDARLDWDEGKVLLMLMVGKKTEQINDKLSTRCFGCPG